MTGYPKTTTEALDENVAVNVQRLGLGHWVFACESLYADTAKFCEHYGYPIETTANTILVYGRADPKKFAACLVLATCKVDVNKTARKLLGVKSASFASAEQTLEITGMTLGGVTAVALPGDLPIYIDKAVMDLDEVLIGGGNRTTKLVLPSSELQKLPAVEIIEGLGIPRS